MSRSLQKLIFKKLDRKAKLYGQLSFLRATNVLRKQLQPVDYDSLIKVYLDIVKKRYGKIYWSGKKNISDLGYNCALLTKGFEDDLLFTVEWLVHHSAQINDSTKLAFEIQELILLEDYKTATKKVNDFQNVNGWSFWVLELSYFLMYKIKGSSGVRSFTKYIKEKAGGRVAGYAASMFSDRVDDRYSIDAYVSRWKENINKSLKGEKSQHYYNFRALGVITEKEQSLGHVICNDFCNSITDCYNSVLESLMYVAASVHDKKLNTATVNAIDKLKAAGVIDFRLDKIKFLITGCYSNYNHHPEYKLTKHLASALYSREAGTFRTIFGKATDANVEILSLTEILQNGASASEQINKLRKFSFGLRFIPLGSALHGFVKQVTERDPFVISNQPWTSLLSPGLVLEEFFCLNEHTSSALENAIDSELIFKSSEIVNSLISIYSLRASFGDPSALPAQVIYWLACQFLKFRRDVECEVCIEYLSKVSPYWARQAGKLKIYLLCSNNEVEKVVNFAYSVIELDPSSAWEFPLEEIFESYDWSELKKLDHTTVAIVSHFTNAMLGNTNEDILYICKMACKTIHENFDRDKFFSNPSITDTSSETMLDSDNKKIQSLITLYSHVWIETNLTFLDFLTSREVMQERLEVLRLLVQLNPENEQRYAAAIMDITLRDTMWEGLTHIEETRIFVNEAGITRWAEKEIRQDFDNWKLTYIYESKSTLINKLFQYDTATTSETVEEFIDYELSEDCRLFVNMIDRLQEKFLHDPTDGLHCYLSARIRHGTMKNTYLGPIDEAGFLTVEGQLDESVSRFIEALDTDQYNEIVKPALIELSASLSGLIDDALENKIRLKSARQPNGYIEIDRDPEFYSKVSDIIITKLEFHQFLALVYNLYWDTLWPSLQRLAEYFDDEVQSKTNTLFEQAIERIDVIGEGARPLSSALTRIKNSTCQKCLVAAGWFKAENHIKDRTFTLSETISIAAKASRNIYRRFNGEIKQMPSSYLDLPLSGVGMAAIVESLTTLFENSWKYSGLSEAKYEIQVEATVILEQDILCLTIINPLSDTRANELTPEALTAIKSKFQIECDLETVADEGGSGFPKVARLSRHLNRDVFPTPLDICVENSQFTVTALVPIHLRGEAYDVYNY